MAPDKKFSYQQLVFPLALIAVLVFGFIVRMAHAKLGLPYIHYWDEPDIASRALRMMQTGDMNPHFFNYGTLMLYLNFIVDKIYMAYISLLPADSSAYIASVADIKTTYNATGWHWTISHPEFYFWNRMFTVLMGTITLLVVYLLGATVYNRWVGLAGAATLAVLPLHIMHSAMITPNVTAVLFMLCVMLFSVLFVKHGKMQYFYLSLLFVGFAIATKYNAGMAALMPLLALLVVYFKREGTEITPWHWAFTAIIPAVVVMAVMPYMLIDLPRFVLDVLIEITHYGRGHRGTTITPGWEHLSVQLNRVHENIGTTLAVLAVAGLVAGLFNRLFLFILVLPVLYIWFMSTRSVSFHRNFLLIYPMIALCVGVAFYQFYRLLDIATMKITRNNLRIAKLTVSGLAVLLIGIKASQAFMEARSAHRSIETRTSAVEILNGMKNVGTVMIAKELMLHHDDLNRLDYSYAVMPLDTMAAGEYEDNTVFLIPAVLSAQYGTDYRKKENSLKQAIIDSVPETEILERIGMMPDRSIDYFAINSEKHANLPSLTKLDIFSINPAMLVVGEIPKRQLDPSLITFDVSEYPEYPTTLDHYGVIWLDDGEIKTPTYKMDPGNYSLLVNARSFLSGRQVSKTLNVYGYEFSANIRKAKKYHLAEKIKISVYANSILISEDIFEMTNEYVQLEVPFSLVDKMDVYATITYVNETPDHSGRPPAKLKELAIRRQVAD